MSEETKMILEKLERLESKMNNMESKMNNMESKMNNVESKMNNMESKMNNVESKMNNMQLTLENETNRSIQIIAEGHANLNRKLDEALKMENEKEMLLIRVNRLENELRQIKERIAGIA